MKRKMWKNDAWTKRNRSDCKLNEHTVLQRFHVVHLLRFILWISWKFYNKELVLRFYCHLFYEHNFENWMKLIWWHFFELRCGFCCSIGVCCVQCTHSLIIINCRRFFHFRLKFPSVIILHIPFCNSMSFANWHSSIKWTWKIRYLIVIVCTMTIHIVFSNTSFQVYGKKRHERFFSISFFVQYFWFIVVNSFYCLLFTQSQSFFMILS